MEPGKKHFSAARTTGKAILGNVPCPKHLVMPNEFDHLGEQERLRAENDFLKLKLMLEHGAIMSCSEGEIPDDIENAFLNNIIEFEKEFDKRKTVKVFDAIGRPSHFKPAAEIRDDQIDEAWQQLRNCLNEHSIDLGVCSPNITKRELYRFTVEELFDHEMDEIKVPGWVNHFIYDEFHPDPVYDNSKIVEEDILHDIFKPGKLFFEQNYREEFMFNDELFTGFNIFNERIELFKSLYEEIELTECSIDTCAVNDDHCIVSGSYIATAKSGNNEDVYKGDFCVELSSPDLYYWYIDSIKIEGFNP